MPGEDSFVSSMPDYSRDPSKRYVDWYSGKRSQRWGTPPEFFEELHQEYRFTLDGAADMDDHLLPRYMAEWDPQSWKGERVFCNPPWSNIPPFVDLATDAELAVLLVPARTNCRWFHRALALGATVRFFKPKLKFVGAKHTSPVDCLLLVWEPWLESDADYGPAFGRWA